MKHKKLLGVGVGLVVILVGLLVSYQTLYAPTEARKSLEKSEKTSAPYEASYTSTYAKGAYTISGTIMLPNQCHRVEATGAFESGVVRVTVSVPSDEGICLEIPTQEDFTVTITGEEGASIEVSVNGVLVPAP